MEVKGLDNVIHGLNAIHGDLTTQLSGLDGGHADFDDVDIALSDVDEALELLQGIANQ